MKKICTLVLASLFCTECYSADTLKIGLTAGPHVEITQFIKSITPDINIEIVEFNDFITPNIALNNGDIDVNSYQHEPFLDEQVASHKYNIVSIGKTILLPMRVYSFRYKKMTQLPKRAKIIIPNDPTNQSRALFLLEKHNLITLKNHSNPSILDIASNPKKLKIVEIEAPQIPRLIQEVDAAVVNLDWILVSNIDAQYSIAAESFESKYFNIIAIQKHNQDNPLIKKFLSQYYSEATKQFVYKHFNGTIITSW